MRILLLQRVSGSAKLNVCHLQPRLTPAASPCAAVVLFLCHRARRRRSEALIAADDGGIKGGGSPEVVYVRQVEPVGVRGAEAFNGMVRNL